MMDFLNDFYVSMETFEINMKFKYVQVNLGSQWNDQSLIIPIIYV